MAARTQEAALDKITESLLTNFPLSMTSFLPEDKQFEHFGCYVTVKHNHNETFETDVYGTEFELLGSDQFRRQQ